MGGTDSRVPFGAELRRHREAAGLTQEELGERAGLTAKAISALERGERRRPYPHNARALAEALGLDEQARAAFIASTPIPGLAIAGDESAAGANGPRPLPPEPNALLGRDDELTVLRDQLVAADVRLMTIVGPGGAGKTRLATAVAHELAHDPTFPDGALFVDLSATPEASLVLPAIARAARVTPGAPGVTAALAEFLASRRLLLVLDNFEQVLDAAGALGDLLATSPTLTVLTTSREPLRLRWERTLPLGPLPLPDPRHLPALDELADVPAVALFLQRVRAVAPGFDLTPANAAAVASLCVRLDGLPLAIELVAGTAARLGPAVALDRLARHLPLPGSTWRDAPARQQSLRAALQWSLDLLAPGEQELFRRLAAFAGGWTVEAADAVVGDGPTDTLPRLLSLVDKCLITTQPTVAHRGDPATDLRFTMLETVRELASELLDESGEADAVRLCHLRYFADLAEEAERSMQGASQAAVVAQLEIEEDNVRQAVRWALSRGRADGLEEALRLAGALGWYWFLHGYPAEARQWFDALLRADVDGEADVGGEHAARAQALRARALNAAGFRATDAGEYGAAAGFHAEALSLWRGLDETPGLVASLHGVGDTALWQGDSDTARASYEEGLSLARSRGASEAVALFAFHLGQLWWLLGDLDAAESYGQEARRVAREARSTTWPPYALFVLASVAHERGVTKLAGRLYREALTLAWEHHDRLCIRMALPGLAALATIEGDPARAVRLAGAASALEENAGIWAFPPIRARHERWMKATEAALPAQARVAAWSEGRKLPIEDVISYALESVTRPSDEMAGAHGVRLSAREREVLGLVAEGKSNREIAEALFVTEHTAKYHVGSLFNKLGANSRAEAVTRAVALGLLDPATD